MKICYVLDDSIYRWGGAQTYVLNLSKWFVKQGHEVFVLTSSNSSVNKRNIGPRIKVYEVSQGRDIKSLSLNGSVSPFPGFASRKTIRVILENEKFDVVHFNYPFSPFVSGRVLKEIKNIKKEDRNIKTFCTFHIHTEEKFIPKISNYGLGIIQKPISRNIDKFTHISKATKEYGQKYLDKESTYIPVGIEDVSVNKKLNDKLNILFLSRLEERKGVIDLIQALGNISIKNKEITNNLDINIAGDGPQRAEAESLAKQYNLNINFHGRVSEEKKHELYTNANISVFPAKFGESFGIVLIEAMNYGCAIIGYANPGYADTLDKFSKDCLVEINNTVDLENKILDFISNKEKTHKLGNKLKEYFEEKFSINAVGEKMLSLYTKEI